jgi:malonyl-CoA/methylmalonyl-CoA synthetase
VTTRGTIVDRVLRLSSAEAEVEDTTGCHSLASIVAGAEALGAKLDAATMLAGERVLLFGTAGSAWAQAFFALLTRRAIVVPVALAASRAELDVLVRDSGARRAIVTDGSDPPLATNVLVERASALIEGDRRVSIPPPPAPNDAALMLYTSGTTGTPKGARITHANLATQVAMLEDAWGMQSSDVLVHALPMHHLHGIVVAFLTTLLTPAKVIALSKFTPAGVLGALERATVFMGVPTMYARIVESFDRADASEQALWRTRFRKLRLITSGSAALPASLAERIRDIAGIIPLERYGMTEIGMALSNSLAPMTRRAGRVGVPLPTVETRIVSDDGRDGDGPGELWVRGPSVFEGYHQREEETRAAFRDEGWFATGDVAERDPVDGSIRLLGRASVDILKSGGEKISALEIEEALREHPSVLDAAVVGVPDETWGDRIVAFVVPRDPFVIDSAEIITWMKQRVSPFKVPKEVRRVALLPRNAMGKVQKKLLTPDT